MEAIKTNRMTVMLQMMKLPSNVENCKSGSVGRVAHELIIEGLAV